MGYRFVRMGYSNVFGVNNFVPAIVFACTMNLNKIFMKKNLLFTWLAFLFTVVTFSQTLDQSLTVYGGASEGRLVGQSFVAGIKGTLSKFSYYYKYPDQGFNSGGVSDYQLLIYSGAGNSGTLLGTQSFSVTQATPTGELEIPITAPIELVAGNTYTIYVSNPTYKYGGSSSSVGVTYNGSSYAAGSLFLDNSPWSYDMWFKTYVTQAPATHLNFDGIDDYVELPSAIEPNLRNNVTVEFWMKSGVTPDQGDALFANGQFGGLGLSLNSNGTVQFSGAGGFQTINSTTSVTDGQWHHVAGSFSDNDYTGTNASLYIDGVLESTTTALENGQISASSTPATIGANSAVPGRNYNGSIEDLRIWNVARTASQISANKACELTGTETDLLAYYTFNQGFGGSDNSSITNLTDASSNGNNGTFNNMSLTGTTSNFIAEAVMQTPVVTVTTPVNYKVGATATALTATTSTTTLVWYDVATGGTALTAAPTPSTTTVGSTSYWVASANAKGCESARTEIVVTINPILPATYLNFDGVNDNVSLPVAIGNTLSGGTELTIEYWFKGTNLQSAVRLQSGGNYIVAGWGTGSPQFIVSTDGGTNGVQIANATAVHDNNWHHVACVWKKNGSFSTYLDGALSNSRSSLPDVNLPVFTGVNVYLGALNGSSEFIKGSLDDVRIWNVAKTGPEINSSKNCALQGNETGLVAYYNFNQGNGGENNTSITSLTDGTGNNNGTLNGFALNGNTSNFLAKDAPLPNLGYTFTKTNASCNGLNDGSIAVSVYGGQAPYSFLWSNSATTSSITGLSAGTYGLLAITDANGCTLRGSDITVPLESIIITEPLPLDNPTVTNPVTYNQNDTATALTATIGENGTGLVWFTTDTGGTALTTAPTPSTTTIGNTSYWVASTNANGCESGRTEIVVTVSSVAKIEIKVTAIASQSKVYGAAEPVLTYTFTPSLANGDTFTGSLSREAGEDVGTYAIGQGDLSADSKYTITFVSSDFTIAAKPITVTADASQTKVYGTTDPSLTYSVSPSLVGTDTFTGTLTRVAGENVSTYSIEQNNLSAGSNYTITYVAKDFAITAKPITITADAKTKVYGAVDPSLTYSVSPSLVGTDTFTGTLTRVTGENVGTYAIEQGTLSAGANYVVTFVPANYSITKADQVITWNQTLVSDCGSSASIALTATSTSGLGISFSSSNSKVATIVNNELVFVNPGSATITASQIGDNNYNAASSIVLPIVNSQPNLIRKQFEDVIFFDNSSNEFVSYTWYKNGVVVAGQTAQYFKETGALNGSYYAVATKKDGTVIRTCPLVLTSNGVVETMNIAPNPVRSNSSYQLITNIEAAKIQNARVTVFNILGSLMTDRVVSESTIEMVAPSVNGIYIVKLTLSNGKMFTKNLLVRN